MKTLLLPFLAMAALVFASPSFAGFKGNAEFTPEEKLEHLRTLKTLTDGAERCLRGELARQQSFITHYGISAYYGDQSKFARKNVIGPDGNVTSVETSLEERRAALEKLGVTEEDARDFLPVDPACTPEKCPLMMQPISCIGLTMKCFGKAFHAAGQDNLWQRISAFTDANGTQGDALIEALHNLGWRTYYWTPDVNRLAEWDAFEQRAYPGNPGHAWGYHAASYRTVTTKGRYYFNTVDDYTTMVNFDQGTPEHLKEVPLFVGIAHLGYHVFPGFRGTVIEGHSARALTDPKTVQASPFAPIAPGGGPGGGPFHSGIIAVPPGF